ncbi:MAG: flagellar basal-body rod protein FlgG [Syntrophorhabdus aromaticivorans]|uniref:Flagellar basal-body rod protein FlgG n=1 Tax=Syntrophorhabdus aromaticivorans TaxID=328301 RepID=A0A351U7X9_9BACT|nr:flagellar basal-body rod protein FlgG [Syntrophorhabdus aromaticivorans]HBA56060.1 flagellar basal-body rod protein FlgG [Syntrophorhabdus aromaticivorans]
MIRALWTAGTGMNVHQANLDVIANNIANVNTNGYKKSRADFQDLMYQTLRLQGVKSEEGNQIPTGIQIGHGAMLAAVQKVFLQGDYQQTGNELDLAIEGNGFLQVTLPSGDKAYTRAGALKRDSDGKIVTSDGYPIEPSITIPQNTINLSIETDGTVSALVQGQSDPQQIGNLELATFSNLAGLKAIGKNLFVETDASGTPVEGRPGENGLGTVLQGYIEMSNVNVMQEMINLIIGQRAYEVNTKAIQAADEMLQMATSIRR